MAGFFEAHPQLEAPVLGVSAKAGKTLHQKLNAVRTALADQQREERDMAAEREAKAKALRVRLQGLVNELHQLLKPEDPSWHSFGIVPRSIQRRKTAEENRRKREAASTMSEGAAESNLVALSQKAA